MTAEALSVPPEGALVRMTPQLPAHAETHHEASLALTAQLSPGWRLRAQLPLVTGDPSEPEPDLAVDLGIEVRLYAGAEVGDYWVLDVDGRGCTPTTAPGRSGPRTPRSTGTGWCARRGTRR